ncbi:MAG TPA: phosphatase PAP2 family protein [Novosphingobium sp.]
MGGLPAWWSKAIVMATIAGVSVTVAAADQSPVKGESPNTPRAAASFLSSGYLPRASLPDSLVLNPPPPATHSQAWKRDEEGAKAAVAIRGGTRWQQATLDADLFSPTATGLFSCAAGIPIESQTAPKTVAVLRKMAADLAMAVYPTKRRYQRDRPFVANKQPVCTPQDRSVLARDGSYPSGHSAIGYGWGLALSEIVPERAAQLVARGRAFGDSRRVCNVHWLSDIEEGRVVATAVVARLHAEPAFRADMDAARAEAASLVRRPMADCAREEAALENR